MFSQKVIKSILIQPFIITLQLTDGKRQKKKIHMNNWKIITGITIVIITIIIIIIIIISHYHYYW